MKTPYVTVGSSRELSKPEKYTLCNLSLLFTYFLSKE